MKSLQSLSARFIVLCLLLSTYSSLQAASVVIDYSIKYQTIEGFGGGLSFHKYPYFHPKKEELYDSIFNKAKINVIRIGNWYTPEADTPVVEVPMMKEIQERWPHVKTMLVSWSPPPSLKSNNSMYGAFEGVADTGTLKKNDDSTYMYEQYGDYWLKSVQYFQANGMKIDWISIQNEADWPAWHEGCVLEGKETATIASYGKAHTAVYNKLKNNLDNMIPMIGPDVAGIYQNRVTRYITSPETNTDEMVAYCHHLYDHPGEEWFINAKATITGKPIYQTEFLINEGKEHGPIILSWIDNARFMHQSLAVEGVSMYNVFALAYNPASMHTFFSMDTLWGDWYETRNAYHVFKQYSANIRRGWRRIEANCDDPTLWISAYSNTANDSAAVVIVNYTANKNTVDMVFPGQVATVIQTSNTRKYEQIGVFNNEGTIQIDSVSVTTINLAATVKATANRAKVRRSNRLLSVTTNRTGQLAITCAAAAPNTHLSLFDCRGNRIVSRNVPVVPSKKSTIRFDTQLAPGRYVVTLSEKNTTKATAVAIVY